MSIILKVSAVCLVPWIISSIFDEKVSTEKNSVLARVSASMLGNIIGARVGQIVFFCLPVVGFRFFLF